RALGCRPADPELAAHYDQVVGTVRASRTTLVATELARYSTAGPARPAPAVEGLAALDLRNLDRFRAERTSDEQRHEVDDAIRWRESTLRLEVLVTPPDWGTANIAARLAGPSSLTPVGKPTAIYPAAPV